ncbi:unnamed protein product (macronuclear) [Paramecium tetraurelia]|uniref:Uncharacterized protein n=1 Tax=Paramecium tetraurelia TaxID=5888 RepID=A0BM45_PARTE|nr:uncharacterized protein GSPATT00030246001 [Paramecium tetraurelia]CAK59612.1 unnamed protein product [Paramecium tetraurelia]|eukprot:XP_001427010.1 hypothetical protein (macronuclear) [Paramecium tetraurelia strain d4-2]
MARKKIKKQKSKCPRSQMTKKEYENFLDETNEYCKLLQTIHPGLVQEEKKLISHKIQEDSD